MPNGSILIGYGDCIWSSYGELDLARPAFFFPDFFLDSPKPWCQYNFTKIFHVNDLLTELGEHENYPGILWNQPDKSLFEEAFLHLKQEISLGLLQKAVPYLFSNSPTNVNLSIFKKMLSSALKYMQSYGGYLFGFWNERKGMLGVTPELLFSKTGRKLQTMALAGTKRKSEGKDALLNDTKEHHEHRLVVEGIVNSLEGLGLVTRGSLDILELPTIYHLMTKIEVNLNTENLFEDIVHRLHPTPALGAIPNPRGAEWLRSYASLIPRGRHGAPAGLIYREQMLDLCLVAIRQTQWNEEGMRTGAGCGIVEESECEKEWQEILLKIGAIKYILGIPEPICTGKID